MGVLTQFTNFLQINQCLSHLVEETDYSSTVCIDSVNTVTTNASQDLKSDGYARKLTMDVGLSLSPSKIILLNITMYIIIKDFHKNFLILHNIHIYLLIFDLNTWKYEDTIFHDAIVLEPTARTYRVQALTNWAGASSNVHS